MATGPDYPKSSGGNTSHGDAALQRAMVALRSDRPNEAERIASEVLQVDPSHICALQIFGSALLMQGRAQDAIAPLEAAARSRNPEIDTMLAIALRQADRQEDALRRFKLATRRRPPYAVAFYELGCLLAAMKRDNEALNAFRRGLEVAPMMPSLSVQLGYLLLRRRNHPDAKAAFARALKISPDSPEALFGMGTVHREVGEIEAAADFFRRCLISRPDNADTWLSLGLCLVELGQLDAGREALRRSARGDRKYYDRALNSLAASARGRFWLRPSAAARFFQAKEN